MIGFPGVNFCEGSSSVRTAGKNSAEEVADGGLFAGLLQLTDLAEPIDTVLPAADFSEVAVADPERDDSCGEADFPEMMENSMTMNRAAILSRGSKVLDKAAGCAPDAAEGEGSQSEGLLHGVGPGAEKNVLTTGGENEEASGQIAMATLFPGLDAAVPAGPASGSGRSTSGGAADEAGQEKPVGTTGGENGGASGQIAMATLFPGLDAAVSAGPASGSGRSTSGGAADEAGSGKNAMTTGSKSVDVSGQTSMPAILQGSEVAVQTGPASGAGRLTAGIDGQAARHDKNTETTSGENVDASGQAAMAAVSSGTVVPVGSVSAGGQPRAYGAAAAATEMPAMEKSDDRAARSSGIEPADQRVSADGKQDLAGQIDAGLPLKTKSAQVAPSAEQLSDAVQALGVNQSKGERRDSEKEGFSPRQELMVEHEMIDLTEKAFRVSPASAPMTPSASGEARVSEFQKLIETMDQRILSMGQSGERNVRMTFQSGELGQLTVTCRDSGASLQIEIEAASSTVQNFLQRQEGVVRELLQAHGTQVGQFDVTSNGGQGGSSPRHESGDARAEGYSEYGSGMETAKPETEETQVQTMKRPGQVSVLA